MYITVFFMCVTKNITVMKYLALSGHVIQSFRIRMNNSDCTAVKETVVEA
jgi:hypothetical protein